MQITRLKPSLIEHEMQRAKQRHGKLRTADSLSIGHAYEAWSGYPDRFFFFNYNQQTYCGQKLISPQMLASGCKVLFCSHITVDMILGLLLHTQTSATGVGLYYEDFIHQDRQYLFNRLMLNRKIDIYFPYTPLKKESHEEYISPPEGWKINPTVDAFLSSGEVSQRQISIDLIKADAKLKPVIYDPACSTGEFLYSIKTAISDANVIGQDLSLEMCVRARERLANITHGDALFPCMPEASCDYIFFRFLNSKVVSVEQAKGLFEAITPCLKETGKIIIFGFTPVLIPLPYLMQQGFNVLSCNAALTKEQALIQYYVIEKF